MSVTALRPARRPTARASVQATLAQAALAVVAVALVGAVVTLVMWFAAPAIAPPSARNPFGMGLREAAPSAGAFGQLVLHYQSAFSLRLREALAAIRTDSAAAWSLVAIGFAYGVFHAAGPGHGKAVISSYIMAGENALRRGISLSFAAAFIQALVAIALVGAVFVVARGTAATMTRTASLVELGGFALVAALGGVMTWRKSGKVLGTVATARRLNAAGGTVTPGEPCDCDHVHMPPPEQIVRSSPRELAVIALGAGIRPCAGAILILVLAVSQNLVGAGVAAVLAMALGTAVTTSALAALAVYAKRLALGLAGGRGLGGTIAVAALELAAAAFVVVLGLSLLNGFWSGARSL